MNRLQASAAWLALLPMAGGLTILGMFVLTDEDVFPLLGLLCLWVGFAMNVGGVVVAIAGHLRARRDGVARVDRWCVTACVSALLAANWGIAVVCFSAGFAWGTRYTLELDNRHATSWTDVELRAPGVERIVSVPAGGAATMYLWFSDDGRLTLRSGSDEVEVDVTSGLGGVGATVVREADGSVGVIRRAH